MKPKPECRKCSGRHWRFVKCDEAEAYAAKEKPKPEIEVVRTRPVLPVYISSLDKTFSSRLITLDSTAPNVYWRKREE